MLLSLPELLLYSLRITKSIRRRILCRTIIGHFEKLLLLWMAKKIHSGL